MKKKINLSILIILIFLITILTFKLFNNKNENCVQNNNKNIKYVFYFIGDGMSLAQVDLTEIYLNQIANSSFTNQKQLIFTKFNTVGLRKNQSGSDYITDSSASASALASGELITNWKVNIDNNGNKIIPITYALKEKGMKIGIVTTVGIDHATPAGFYAYSQSRDDYNEIASQIADSKFDYFAGSIVIGRNDDVMSKIQNNGYKIIDTENDFKNMKKGQKYLVLSPIPNSVGELNYGIDQKGEIWTLENYIEKGIELLDNEKGFFIMGESGMIDHAGHSNDARSVISEVEELNKAVEKAIEFANKHPDETLIIVTGDHETGGLSLGGYVNYQSLDSLKMSYVALNDYGRKVITENISLEEVEKYISENCGININKEENYNMIKSAYENLKNDPESLRYSVIKYKNEESGIVFTTYGHTGESVPVYVYGDKTNIFGGVYRTDELNQRLRKVLGI